MAKMKKFTEYKEKQNIIPEEVKTPKPQNIELLESFSNNYKKFSDAIEKAELLESFFNGGDSSVIMQRDEIEQLFLSHLLVVNENIEYLKKDLTKINESDMNLLSDLIQHVDKKTNKIIRYINEEVPKNKKKIIETEFNINKALSLTKKHVDELQEFVDSETDIFNNLNSKIDYINELVESNKNKLIETEFNTNKALSLNTEALKNTETKLEKLESVVEAESHNLNLLSVKLQEASELTATNKETLLTDIKYLYLDIESVGTKVKSLSEKYDNSITPFLDKINKFQEKIDTINSVNEEYNKTIDKTKKEIVETIREVNSIFINSKYDELDTKIDKVNKLYEELNTVNVVKATLNEVTPPAASPVQPYIQSQEIVGLNNKIKFLERAISRIAATGPGSGEVNLRWLDDVDRATIGDGKYLNYNATTKKFQFSTVSGGTGGSFSGSYNDLTDKPTIPAAQVNSDWNAVSGLAQILNKPTLFSGSYTDLTNKPSIPSLTGYATETYVGTAISNLVNTAPATLDTLNELAAALGNDANFSTTIATTLGNKADKTELFSRAYADLTGKPTLFSGAYADLTGKPTLGTISSQSDSSVSITGGSINGTTVGATTPTTGSFTTLIGGAGSANYVQVVGAASAGIPVISAQGSDTNINLTLTPKGTGRVIVTTGIKARVNSIAVAAGTTSQSWTSDSYDQYNLTLSNTATLTISLDTGVPTDGQKMMFRIKDDGTVRNIYWTTSGTNCFRVVGTTLPTSTTTMYKLTYVGCIYNATASTWDVIAVGKEA